MSFKYPGNLATNAQAKCGVRLDIEETDLVGRCPNVSLQIYDHVQLNQYANAKTHALSPGQYSPYMTTKVLIL